MTRWEPPERSGARTPVVVAVALMVVVAALLAQPLVDPHEPLAVDDAPTGPSEPPSEPPWTPPAAGRWRPLQGAPLQPRIAHTTVWTGERLFVWGGFDSGARPLTDGALFDPVAGAWQSVPRFELAATAEQAAVVDNHVVVVAVTAAAAFDTRRRRWEAMPAPPLPTGHTLADQVVSTGDLAAVLTFSRTSSRPAVLVLDPDAGWRRLPDPPVRYSAGDLLLAGRGRLELYSRPTNERAAAVHRLDVADDAGTWRPEDAPNGLQRRQVVRLAGASRDGRTVLWATTPAGEPGFVAARRNGGWRRLPTPPLPATGRVDVLDAGESVVLWDRRAGRGAILDDDRSRWTVLPPPPVTDVAAQPAVWTGDSIIIWGGLTSRGALYRPDG